MSKEQIKQRLQLLDREEYRRVLILRREAVDIKIAKVEKQIKKLKETNI